LDRDLELRLAHDLLQRSSHREIPDFNLASLLPETAFSEHHVLTTGVALVLLAWSH